MSLTIPSLGRTIPFEYVFEFELDGHGGSAFDRVEVSVEASFVAVSIGCGAVATPSSLRFGPAPANPMAAGVARTPGSFTLDEIQGGLDAALLRGEGGDSTYDLYRDGLRLAPGVAERLAQPMTAGQLDRIFEIGGRREDDPAFQYVMADEGSQREFMSEPVLSLAALGSTDGRRPFRAFATPITFEPRTSIRIEVRPLTLWRGELQIVLHGYKTLGEAGTPTSEASRRRLRRGRGVSR